MRILCRDFGWTTDGEVMQSEAPGDRYTDFLDIQEIAGVANPVAVDTDPDPAVKTKTDMTHKKTPEPNPTLFQLHFNT